MNKRYLKHWAMYDAPCLVLLLAVIVCAAVLGGVDRVRYTGVAEDPPQLSEPLTVGAYVRVRAGDRRGTYAAYGTSEEQSSGSATYTYEVFEVGDKLVGVRLGKAQQPLLASEDAHIAGTLLPAEPEPLKLLREWVKKNLYVSDVVAIGQMTPEYQLYADYYGTHSRQWCDWMFVIMFCATLSVLWSLAVFAARLRSNRRCRADYNEGRDFGQLHVSPQNVWIFRAFKIVQMGRREIAKAMLRYKRKEGGVLVWLVVFEKHDQTEYTALMATEAQARDALRCYGVGDGVDDVAE